MKDKFCIYILCATALIATIPVSSSAKQYKPYPDNNFSYHAEVYDEPPSNDVLPSIIHISGTGGITVNTTQTGYQTFDVAIDGSGLFRGGGTAGSATSPINRMPASKEDSDFTAAAGSIYFVEKSATCTLPSAIGLGGQEILVWNTCKRGGVVKYSTVPGQTVSGAANLDNVTSPSLDRLMSDGENWYKE